MAQMALIATLNGLIALAPPDKRASLRRRVITALAQLQQQGLLSAEDSASVLGDSLFDPDWSVRALALSQLERSGADAACASGRLVRFALEEPRPLLRARARALLERLGIRESELALTPQVPETLSLRS